MTILVTQLALAQVSDAFSDGNFTHDPSWGGDTSLFIVQQNQLMLNAPLAEGVAYLSFSSSLSSNAIWECRINLAFNPSSANYTLFYLVADDSVLLNPLSGYFVMAGGADDDLCLYKQEGATVIKIIDGQDGRLNGSSSSFRIKVIHDVNGWQLFSALATETYMLEGAAESPVIQGKYAGVVCHFTSTRSDKFSFDDFLISKSSMADEIAPALISIEVITQREVKLVFSEPVDASGTKNTNNYQIDGLESVQVASTSTEGSTVILLLDSDIPENMHFQLTISGISDLSGNTISPATNSLFFSKIIETHFKDVVITEIMPDPYPTVGLPETEFIEIYNRTSRTLNISGWTITDGSSLAVLPEAILPPSEFLVLLPQSANNTNFERYIALEKFPSLNNNSDVLVLKNNLGSLLDSVHYSSNWYKSRQKVEGGWSLEIIDPHNVCSEAANWTASDDVSGGTPGRQNSVYANKPDLTPPELLYAIPTDPFTINVHFNEKLDQRLPPTSSFEITPGIPITHTEFTDHSLTSIKLFLGDALQPAQMYSLTSTGVLDCAGNAMTNFERLIPFGLPEQPDSLDVLINEILFNPTATGSDFVEVINNSTKYLNLKGWYVANHNNGIIENKTLVSTDDFLVGPGEILALSDDTELVKNEYINAVGGNFLELPKLPSFPDDEGSVALVDSTGALIDFFHYNKRMHSTFLKDDDGVSLERISAMAISDNWKSASSFSGFATPGHKNSNSVEWEGLISNPVTVDPDVFNPLGEAPTFTQIQYAFDHGGYVGTICIYDSQGHLIKKIANNELLGTTGFYRWDGDRDDGRKANVGYYMVAFEVFDEHGTIKRFRAPVAVAASF